VTRHRTPKKTTFVLCSSLFRLVDAIIKSMSSQQALVRTYFPLWREDARPSRNETSLRLRQYSRFDAQHNGADDPVGKKNKIYVDDDV
jgi:hypothetical protein